MEKLTPRLFLSAIENTRAELNWSIDLDYLLNRPLAAGPQAKGFLAWLSNTALGNSIMFMYKAVVP